MKAKAKAKEIVESYQNPIEFYFNGDKPFNTNKDAKMYALIHVNGIIEAFTKFQNESHSDEYFKIYNEILDYKDVLKEIELVKI